MFDGDISHGIVAWAGEAGGDGGEGGGRCGLAPVHLHPRHGDLQLGLQE